MPISDTFVTSDGVRLRVVEDGPSEAPVTIVLMHGWMLSTHSWDRVVAGLLNDLAPSARIVRFDLRGHGGSDPAPTGTGTIARCADDLAEVIADRVPNGPIVLAGHSMGGMSLLALAERHPALVRERVVGVGLVASSGGDLKAPTYGVSGPVSDVINAVERWSRAPMSRLRVNRVSVRSGWLRPFLRWLLFGVRPSASDISATADWCAACFPANVPEFRVSLAEHERIAALREFRSIPTTILVGGRDRLCPPVHTYRMAERLPMATVRIYGGAGHMLTLERTPEVTARLIELVRAATGEDSRSAAA